MPMPREGVAARMRVRVSVGGMVLVVGSLNWDSGWVDGGDLDIA